MTRRPLGLCICASTVVLVGVFFVIQPTILESAAPRRRPASAFADNSVPAALAFRGPAAALATGARFTSPSTVSASCADAPATSASCRFFLDAAVLPPGSASHCLPATAGLLVPLPWCVIVCGGGGKTCTFSTQGKRHHPTAKTALIGIHGGPGQSSGIIRDLARLSSPALPVILYDQRGAGRSAELPSPTGTDIDDTMRTYVDELRAVLRRFGVEHAHLVGHSFGAAIAIRFARTFPELTVSLSLLSPTVDGAWWQEDADFHRSYLGDPDGAHAAFSMDAPPAKGDAAASAELLQRWVLGDALSVQDIAPLMCKPNGDVYSTVWGGNEDVVDGQTANLHLAEDVKALVTEQNMPVLLGCGVLDEATPKRMLEFARMLDGNGGGEEGDYGAGAKRNTPRIIVLPHSSHVIRDMDWGYYIDALRRLVTGANPVPIAVPPLTPLLGASENSAADVSSFLPSDAAVRASLLGMQASLRMLESDASVVKRSYPYLGRLLTLKQPPTQGFRQLDQTAMLALIGNGDDDDDASARVDWDAIQAVVDVWYVASIIDPGRIDDPTLKPPASLLRALAGKMRSTYRQSSSPIDRIMYYVVGMALDRLRVEGAPAIEAFEWRSLAKEIDMKQRYPAIYMYLLTHVYIYNTDFGTIPVRSATPVVRAEIEAATDELIEMTPLALEPRGAQRVYNGMTSGGAVGDDTKYDLICELFFTMIRVHGPRHPVSAMLAVRVRGFLAQRTSHPEADKEKGHLVAVCLASWVVWEEATTYI